MWEKIQLGLDCHGGKTLSKEELGQDQKQRGLIVVHCPAIALEIQKTKYQDYK